MPSIPLTHWVRRVFIGNSHLFRNRHWFKARTLLLSLACVFVAAWTPELRAQRAEIVETLIIEDEFGSGGWLALKLRLLPNQFAQIEASSD